MQVPEYSIAWVANVFGLGEPGMAYVGGRGQKRTRSGSCGSRRRVVLRRQAVERRVQSGRPRRRARGRGRRISDANPGMDDGQAKDAGTSFRVGALLAALHSLPVDASALAEEPWKPLGTRGRAFVDGYRGAGESFRSRGLSDLAHHVRSLLSWTTYNVRRDLSDEPGPDAELTPALLSHVRGLDLALLNATATLLATL